MLTNPDDKIPEVAYADIKGVSPTYVPFRNGLMLSAITSFAAGMLSDNDESESGIYFGAHAEDAQNWAYPDCTFEFSGAMANAIFIGTYYKLRLHVPLIWMVKKEIIQKGADLGVDFSKTWSCYVGGDKHCGVCPTCRSRRLGFIDAGITDPTEYAT
jgi:7-cyano-7-deazaguanine synthase